MVQRASRERPRELKTEDIRGGAAGAGYVVCHLPCLGAPCPSSSSARVRACERPPSRAHALCFLMRLPLPACLQPAACLPCTRRPSSLARPSADVATPSAHSFIDCIASPSLLPTVRHLRPQSAGTVQQQMRAMFAWGGSASGMLRPLRVCRGLIRLTPRARPSASAGARASHADAAPAPACCAPCAGGLRGGARTLGSACNGPWERQRANDTCSEQDSGRWRWRRAFCECAAVTTDKRGCARIRSRASRHGTAPDPHPACRLPRVGALGPSAARRARQAARSQEPGGRKLGSELGSQRPSGTSVPSPLPWLQLVRPATT